MALSILLLQQHCFYVRVQFGIFLRSLSCTFNIGCPALSKKIIFFIIFFIIYYYHYLILSFLFYFLDICSLRVDRVHPLFLYSHASSHREHLHPVPPSVDIAILISSSLPLVIYELYHILPTNETRTRACSRGRVTARDDDAPDSRCFAHDSHMQNGESIIVGLSSRDCLNLIGD